ncbi:phage DNA ejection protein [Pluralibacter gergoviae]|uniref:phage DNA ejection protein n=1 Tax=Pluralibacter gergoviae TaxID=61647 RepID=UPI00069FA33D|nr:phage DNA ejection protein [Pluralibacter gergoviae]
MAGPYDYTSGNGFGQGLQLAGLFQQTQQQRAQAEQAERDRATALQFQQDWQSSFGDPQKMTALAAKYPGQMEAIKAGIGFQGEQHQADLGNAARDLRIAIATKNPQAVQAAAAKHAGVLATIGSSPEDIAQQFQSDPSSLSQVVDAVGMNALGAKDYYGVENDRSQRANETARLNESIRQANMQNATTIRGQNISAQNSMRSAGGSVPSSVREYQYFNSLSPEQQQTYLRVRGRPGGDANNTVQLADGRTVTVADKLHGSGANAFYEGRDDNGNMVRVPASSISAPPTSAASAQNYAMKKDIDAIANADAGNLDFMTGVTGGSGNPAIGADVRSRIGGKEQRQLYNAARRVQGRMQNQGVAAARDMGASGINTVAEAKMYFQGMPQVDYSSPEAMQQSIRDISEYTNNYNQQYQVNVGGRNSTTKPASAAPANSGYQSLWGD